MAKRAAISTKTTRNKKFNSYEYQDAFNNNITATVASATANTKNGKKNIRLLDISDAVKKSGEDIKADALNNMTLVELNTGFDTDTARLVSYFALNGRPDPDVDPQMAKIYDKLKKALEKVDLSYEKVSKMLINYDDDVLNNEKDYFIFGAPDQVVLNNRQHYNNCGIESTLNTLAMAGFIKMDETTNSQKGTEKNFLKEVWKRNLADDDGEIGVLDEPDGGTLPDDYRDIMEYYGINSTSYYITNKADDYVYSDTKINELAYKISQGYGAVIGVSSDVLWNETQSETGDGSKRLDHAIAITGVVYDKANPTQEDAPVGFYVHDTGAWMTRFISLDDFKKATLCDYIYGEKDSEENKTLSTLIEHDSKTDTDIKKTEKGIFVTITDEPVKTSAFNLNANGDKYANLIFGNNQQNTIKGMDGNDKLYGNGNNDKLYGGVGNDIIVGNNVFAINATVGEDVFSFDTIKDFEKYAQEASMLNDSLKDRLSSIEVSNYNPSTPFENLVELYDYISEVLPYGINTIHGDKGSDIIIGGEQADLIYGDSGQDYIYGGDGRNAIYAGSGNDLLVGGFDNDKLFGDVGNDYIFGLADEDTINGGDGDDHIYGGEGDDRIETGTGKDTVYFGGNTYGYDSISVKSGSTIFRFIDDEYGNNASFASDMFYTLEKDDEKNNVKSLKITYKQTEYKAGDSQIKYQEFYNTKTKKARNLTISAADGKYKVVALKEAKVIAAKGTNNIILSAYTKGAKITTSDNNDIVTMLAAANGSPDDAVDKITYTGGTDKYVSQERDTYYKVGMICSDTRLSIYDNVIGTKNTAFDIESYKQAIAINPAADINDYMKIDNNYTSKDDRLYTTSTAGSFTLFFDVSVGNDEKGYTTSNNGFYFLSDADENIFTNIVKGSPLTGGIYMDSFFGYDNEHDAGYEFKLPTEDITFYGNGQIEHVYCDDKEYAYTNDVLAIASSVANWLSTSTYTSAFDAFADETSSKDISGLVEIYLNGNDFMGA